MRFRLMLLAMVLAVGSAAWAQKNTASSAKPLKARPTSEFKVNNDAKKSSASGPAPGAPASAKNLHNIEREPSKGNNKASSKKTAVAVPKERDKSSKINFKATGAQKSGGSRPTPDPYKGRLKQKGQH